MLLAGPAALLRDPSHMPSPFHVACASLNTGLISYLLDLDPTLAHARGRGGEETQVSHTSRAVLHLCLVLF